MKNICSGIVILIFSSLVRLNAQIDFSTPQYIDSVEYFAGFHRYIADLDNDGDDDILTLTEDYENRVVWFEQDADHRFARQHIVSKIPYTNPLGNVFPADMDYDGDVDIVEIRNGVSDNLIWHENDGAGNFPIKHVIKTVPFQCGMVVADDLDDDGDQDLIVANNNTNKHIVLVQNLGNGAFGVPKTLITSTQYVYDFMVSELNGQAGKEIIYRTQSNIYDPVMVKLRCAGKDQSGNYTIDNLIADSLSRRPLRIRDMDMDNIPDLVTLKFYPEGPITWFKNDGGAQFSTEKYLPGNSNYYDVAVADFDHDGDADVIGFPDYFVTVQKNIHLFLNDGAGGFVNLDIQDTDIEEGVGDVFVTDWNQDQTPDLLLVNYYNIYRCENDGAAHFTKGETTAQGEFTASEFRAYDLDGDGKKDIVNTLGQATIWYKNLGNGSFAQNERLLPTYILMENAWGDMDDDGDIDLVQVNRFGLHWYPNDGTGHFGSGNQIFNLYMVRQPRLSDIDLDGDLDILFYSSTTLMGYPSIGILINNGDGTFEQAPTLNLGMSWIGDFFLGDLNGDQFPDVYAYEISEKMIWYKNNGTGQFDGNQLFIGNAAEAVAFKAADMDADGDLDIVLGQDIPADIISIFKNNGSGIFSPAQQQEAGLGNFHISGLDIADLDHDGLADVLLSGAGKGLPWFKNDGSGQLQTAQLIDTVKQWDIDMLDLDSDGDFDIIGRSYPPSGIYRLENQAITNIATPGDPQPAISLNPNPAVSETQIKIQPDLLQNQYLIELRDLNGKTLNTCKTNDSNFTLQRNGLPAGAYFLRVREAKSGKLLGVEKLIWN